MKGTIITWGCFDGVHLGHKKIISKVVKWAKATNLSSCVLTFDSHPQTVIYNKNIPLLTSARQKWDLIRVLGVDRCVVVPFTMGFSKIPAEKFVMDIWKKFWVKGIVVGFDTSFGYGKKGDFGLLKRIAKKLDIKVRSCNPLLFRGVPISSSLIRETISKGKLSIAFRLLGRPVSLSGVIVRGFARGRKIGYPTANLKLEYGVLPPRGVYSSEVVIDGSIFRGVTNIGICPTFNSSTKPDVVETHIINFDRHKNLYHKHILVNLFSKIRDEKKFSCVSELQDQIAKDIANFSPKPKNYYHLR